MIIDLGVDLGNSLTKSQDTIIHSNYEGPYKTKPSYVSSYLFFNDTYYAPSVGNPFYVKDKTKDERAIVLTLFSIASQLITKYAEKFNNDRNEIQKALNNVNAIALGVGLPIAHYKKTYIENLITYYKQYFRDGIRFVCDDYIFNLSLALCRVYPQGAAAVFCKANKMAAQSNVYYVVDIGSYTVDVGQIIDGSPAKDRYSLELGTIPMSDMIIEKINYDFDIDIDADIVQKVLRNEHTILQPEVINVIKSLSQKHSDDIINSLRQRKILFDSYPCLFIGGGALLLKPFLLQNPLISRCKESTQFITDIRANAKAYARLIREERKLLAQKK